MASKKRVKRTNKHHRRSRSKTGGVAFNGDIEGVPNVIVVDWKQHQAFHLLFPDTEPSVIARTLNQVWVDPASMLICVPVALAREIVRHYHLQQPS